MKSIDYKKRIRNLQKIISKTDIDFVLLASTEELDASACYFSGDFTTPSFVVIGKDFSLISSLHKEDFSGIFDKTLALSVFKQKIYEIIENKKNCTVAIDDNSNSCGMVFRIREKYPKIKVVAYSNQLSIMRNVKEQIEIENIKKAQKVTNAILDELEGLYFEKKLVDKTEHEVIGWLEKRAREFQMSLDSFSPMVLTGSRTWFFHNNPSGEKIRENELMLVDIGTKYNFYCADATRTWYSGNDKKIKTAIEAVTLSKNEAEKIAKPGILGQTVSDAALKVIDEYGFEKYSFRKTGLSLGHFVGLKVHDGTSFEKQILEKNMVFTIEPGIYVPKKFGIRMEDIKIL